MKIVGITGGIGSGKSIVVSFLQYTGIPVYIADVEAKKIMDTSQLVKKELTARFGTDVYKEGILDRKLLASLIFNSRENLTFVNSVVHPEVLKDFQLWTAMQENAPFVVMESAILFEAAFNTHVDAIIAVTAPLNLRIERVMQRDHISKELILERVKSQMPEEEKCLLSDYVIYNDDVQSVVYQVERVMSQI